MSFSTNSSPSPPSFALVLAGVGNPPSLVAAAAASSDSVPGSEEAETCFDVDEGGAIPKYGREYDFRNIESSGREDNVGSLESYPRYDITICH